LQLGTLSSRPAAASVSDAVGQTDDLLVLELDITSPASAVAAVESASERFGRIDVLVNNAGNFFAGFFEKLSPAQFEAQLTTNLLGPLNVTRAVLPLMRKQRSGHVVTISSTEGIVGQEFCSAYAASKFGLEGWMESLRFEVEPFGIQTTIVEPGFFRTDLLTKESTAYADLSIDDYAERTAQTRPAWEAMSGKQTNDPAKPGRLCSRSSIRTSRLGVGLQAPTRSQPSKRKPMSCWRKSMRTATSPRRSPSRRLERAGATGGPTHARASFPHAGPSGVHPAAAVSLERPLSESEHETGAIGFWIPNDELR
jgi:NAD(P)-dependent dehydrogenase (short-subunit alcohol dehydrogenase family)